MDQAIKRGSGFLLRLPASVRLEADDFANKDGVSLNRFISQAVAEKNVRMRANDVHPPAEKSRPVLSSRTLP